MPTVRSHEAEIYYESHGEGPPLVLAHGAGGNTLIWWQQIPVFARTHRVIVFDHRCFGRSRCAKSDFLARRFPDDLVAVLDHAGIEKAPVVAMSMGGWTGLPAAVHHPQRVERLVLCGTPGGFITPGVTEAMIRVARGAQTDAVGALRGDITFSKRFREDEAELVHLYDAISALNEGFESEMLVALAAPEARIAEAQLERYATPTLMVAAEFDELFPVPVLREVADAIPGCAFTHFPDAGHSMYYENPTLFEEIVRAFIEG